MKLIMQLSRQNTPIEITTPRGYRYILFYGNSALLNWLILFPYVQLAVVAIFAFFAFMTFRTSKQDEQNRVWIGLAKETAHQLGTPISSLMGWLEYLRSQGVNPDAVETALLHGYIPVVSTVAQGVDADTAYNINADTAAAQLAVALGAEKLILLTDIRGLLRDPHDEETLIHVVHTYDVPGLIADGTISGGMIPKMECCVDAINGGVDRVHILDGRIPHSILIELLSDRGIGTMLKREENMHYEFQ